MIIEFRLTEKYFRFNIFSTLVQYLLPLITI